MMQALHSPPAMQFLSNQTVEWSALYCEPRASSYKEAKRGRCSGIQAKSTRWSSSGAGL